MTTKSARLAATALAATLLVGCATVPTGPYVAALPGSRSTVEKFSADDGTCRGRAQSHFGAYAAQPANDVAAANVVAGTLIGAAIGALFGAAVGDPGTGAAIGAGTGLLGGGLVAADTSGYSSAQLQATYDRIYLQCMYALGHRVPQSAVAYRTYRYPAPPGAASPPPDTPPPVRRYAPPTTAPPPAGFPPADAPPPGTSPRG